VFDAIPFGRIDDGPLAGAWKLALTVAETFATTPATTTVRLTAPELAGFSYDAGQDLMVAVPVGDGTTTNRRYTIRRFDHPARTLDLEIVTHGDGPGARWAATVTPGASVVAIGPRGKVTLRDGADWHLFAADDSGVPATLHMLEALPDGARAIAHLDVESAAEMRAVDLPDGVDVVWHPRGGAPAATSTALARAVAGLDLPGGRGHAYLAAERGVVTAVRRVLIDRDVAPDQLSAKAYWRADQPNAAHGEPGRDG
jgi:NADPH-dependent ferric siderophore reductase